MDQLLDEVDSLQHSELANLTGNWCETCESLRQEVKRLQDDQVQNFSKLKQKIISTDLLIKKYKSKCDDYDSQSKRLEETTRRLEKTQRQAETLELQLKSSLLETEPLRKSKQSVEVELRLKVAELEDVNNKLVCAQGLEQQIQGENRYLQGQIDKLHEEKSALKEKLNWYKRTERDEDTIKQLKLELSSAKKENSSLKKERDKMLRKEKTLEQKLQDTTEKMNHYCTILKQRKLMTAAKKSLSNLRSPSKPCVTSDSDISFEGRDSFMEEVKQAEPYLESSSEDDNDSFFQLPWAFSPLVKCLSPLPPSPECFGEKQTVEVEEEEDDDDDDDDEYISDLAEELEHQLMDILSEDEITEIDSTAKTDSQSEAKLDTILDDIIDNAYENDGAKTSSDLYEIPNIDEDTVAVPGKKSGTAAVNNSQVCAQNTQSFAKVFNHETQTFASNDSLCRDILDDIVNEIISVSEWESHKENELTLGKDVEQTVYCDDTTVFKMQHSTFESGSSVEGSDLKNNSAAQIENIDEIISHDTQTFTSPKSLKQRLKESSLVISPVCPRQTRSSDRANNSSLSNKSDSHETCISGSVTYKDGSDSQQGKSDLNSEQTTVLSRSNTGEFTPLINDTEESPTPIGKGKNKFFILGEESTCVHSIKNLNLSETDENKNVAKKANRKNTTSLAASSPSVKPNLKRQMALRKDSSSDVLGGKKCSYTNNEGKSTMSGTKNKILTRSKSVPNKWISFQKGTCETLAEEMIKYDVSKGGYESGEISQNSAIENPSTASSKAEQELEKQGETKTSSQKLGPDDAKVPVNHIEEKENNNLRVNDNAEPFVPVARRTRRSSRLLSLSENKADVVDSKTDFVEETENKIVLGEKLQMESYTTDTKDNIAQKCKETEVETQTDSEKIESKNLESEKDRTNETGSCSIHNVEAENINAQSEVDFKGDYCKNVKEVHLNEINVNAKDDIDNSNLEPDTTGSKVTPSRQLSTGFNLLSPTRNDMKTMDHSPVVLKEVLTEEDDDMSSVDNVKEMPSVILDINDIIEDRDVSSIREQTDSVGNKDKSNRDIQITNLSKNGGVSLRDTGEIHLNSKSCNEKHNLNVILLENRMTADKDSGKSSTVPIFESVSSDDNKLIKRRSNSTTSDDSSLDESSVLSSLPMSPFELVDLISPLPPSPVSFNEPLSPVSENCQQDTEFQDTKSDKTSEVMQTSTESRISEDKNDAISDTIQLSPIPTMLSPVYTPKRTKISNKKMVELHFKETVSEPCKFISDVPKGIINVKPKTVLEKGADLISKTTQKHTEQDSDLDKVMKSSVFAMANSVEESCHLSDSLPVKPKTCKVAVAVEDNASGNKDEVAVEVPLKSNSTKIDDSNINESGFKPVKLISSENQGSVSLDKEKIVNNSEKAQTDTKLDSYVVGTESVGGYDNLVASKTKTRQAHQPKQPRIPVKKPIPVIEAPAMPVNRKRKSLDKDKEVEEKKPCKEQVFKRRQKSESKKKAAENKLMQSFLKSSDTPESIVNKFETQDSEVVESAEYRAITACFECLSRIRNDTLDAVHESCTTEDYLNIIDDWPYMFPVEKQAVELCWHCTQGEKQVLTRAQIMEELWKRIFNSEHGTSISGKKSLCRLFTALCFKAGNVEEVRVLYYHVVLCGYMTVTSFLVPIISVWPEALRREDDNDHGMVMVLEYLVMKLLKNQENENNKKIKDCAIKLCNWAEERDSADNILVNLIKKLQTVTEDNSSAAETFELAKSIELLSLKEGWNWYYRSFVCRYCLQTMSNKWQAKGRTCGLSSYYICTVLKITATLMCNLTPNSKQFTDTIRHWILPILRKEPSCPAVRNCCIETLLELSCHTPKVLCNLQGWYYMFKGTIRPDLEQRMEVLRLEYHTKFGLLCDPFRRKFQKALH